ncbi:hypothetical protein ABPG74_017641 [Tetrahymena malaccensis]
MNSILKSFVKIPNFVQAQQLYKMPQFKFSEEVKVETKKTTLRPKKAFLTLTDRAAARIKELMMKRTTEDVKGVKIGVRRRGCSGLTYTMNYCTSLSDNKFDEIINDKGVTIVIDNKALMALVGTEMDWVEDDLKAEFVFNNPNSKGTCGCGESFHI